MSTPGVVGVKQSASPDRMVDSIVVLNEDGASVYRQRVATIGDEVAVSTQVTEVAATTTPFTVGSHTDTRLAMTVYVEPGQGASTLYLKFGAGASASSYSNRLGPGDYWESTPPRYTGPTTAVFDGTQGRIFVTEFLSG
jgi:hypothetical protein